MVEEQPWDKDTAEKYIHQLARSEDLALSKQPHAEERMLQRGILARDVLYVLKHGIILADKTEPSTRDGFFKYAIQSKTPNSEGEIIRAVVIPCLEKIHMTVLTVMWAKAKAEGECEDVGEKRNGAKRDE